MLSQEKRIKRKREDADANANADGRHAGVSTNNVVHVEAEAHATHPTDMTRQLGRVKAPRRSRKDTHRLNLSTSSVRTTIEMQATTAQAERCRVIARYLRGVTSRIGGILFTQLKI